MALLTAGLSDRVRALTHREATAQRPLVEAGVAMEIHDRQQVELRLSYPLDDMGELTSLVAEVFVFVPRNVGLNASNYPREEFYGDLTSLLRVDLPDLTLEELADDAFGASPLASLRAHLATIAGEGRPQQPVATDVQLFGHSFTEAVRDALTPLVDELATLHLAAPGRVWAYLDEVDRFAASARNALVSLRRARRAFSPFARSVPNAERVFAWTDEYCSLFLDGALARLAAEAQAAPALFDGSGFVGRLRHVLARHAEPEARYRADKGYLRLDDTRGAAAEYFAYRQSFLKKAVQQALYVDTRRLPTDTYVRNATGAVAAGLAATWALVAQLPSELQNLSPTAQTLVLALPVLAYVGKDRLKELSREWLARRLRASDNDTGLRVGSLTEAGLGAFSGRIRERVRFISLAEIPAPVRAARTARRTVASAEIAGESVLHYARRVELNKAGKEPIRAGLSLRETLRLNLRHFLTRLDEPEQHETHWSSEQHRFLDVALPKVYHLNVVVRVAAAGRRPTLHRWRIILNQRGLVRLEPVEGLPSAPGPAAPAAPAATSRSAGR